MIFKIFKSLKFNLNKNKRVENICRISESNCDFNKKQFNKMKGTIQDSLDFKWDDKILFNNILLNRLDELKLSGYELNNEEYKENIKSLNLLIKQYNSRMINKEEYKKQSDEIVKNLEDLLSKKEINTAKIYLRNYYNSYEIESILKYNKKILISGDGGIGKSYLIFKFSEYCEKNKINYLCTYGKFNPDFENIDLDNIESITNEVYFIIDAFNEYSKIGQQKILKFIRKIQKKDNIRLIMSYRNKSMTDKEIKRLKENFKNETYDFFGVDLEESIINIIDEYGVDITKYENIINFQNPLYLKLLIKCLEDDKIKKELENSESQITYIYESFIKKHSKQYWDLTKNVIAKYMYTHAQKYIEESELKALLTDDYEGFIKVMQEQGLLYYRVKDSKKLYYYNIDTLNDFIIARAFLQDIDVKTEKEVIDLINEKLNSVYSLSVPFIICLFDKYKNDIEIAIRIVFTSDLKFAFNIELLRMIKFEKETIETIQKALASKLDEENFYNLAGYANKPFNCINYLNQKIINEKNILNSLSIFNYDIDYLLKKLRVILTILKKENKSEELYKKSEMQEYFWFSFWLTSHINTEIRMIANKIIYEICNKSNMFFEELIKIYNDIQDDYIKESIVSIICCSPKYIIKKYKNFLEKIYKDYEEVNSLILVRIDNALFNSERKYIRENKNNVFKDVKIMELKKEFLNLLNSVDLQDKNFLPWRFWSENHIDNNLKFLKENKSKITKINDILTKKYPCLIDDVTYCKYNKEDLFKDNKIKINEEKIEDKIILLIYQQIVYEICEKYSCDINMKRLYYEYPSFFSNSLLHKCLQIALRQLEGYLMCNYYEIDFCINGSNFEKKVGFAIHNPFEYEDSFEINYFHPISSFNILVDKLDFLLQEKVPQSITKESGWEDDVNDIKNNIFKFIEPILIKNQKWYLLAADIRYSYKEDERIKWLDTYLIKSTYKSEKHLTGKGDRYITIEDEEFKECIEDYIMTDSSECKNIKQIRYDSTVFNQNILHLPPSKLLKDCSLNYNSIDSTWRNDKNEIIIICSNNDKMMYKDVVLESIYIREDYYFKVKDNINYFSFSSRSNGEGYSPISEFHMEFVQGKEINTINNEMQNTEIKRCKECKYDKIQTEEDLEQIKLEFDKKFKELYTNLE